MKTKLFKSFSSLVLSELGALDGTITLFWEMLTLWGIGEGESIEKSPSNYKKRIWLLPPETE